ncbi:MAG: glycosyltransferase family 2 protein [Anaerostipes sp.]|nr:glycosyltransferase family 2 protein [Anaerostipes sp.]
MYEVIYKDANEKRGIKMPALTIFTPSYNRADLLPRGYEALKRQTNKDFIWMIVDDGSTDNTSQIVKPWLKDTSVGFEVQYMKKENGGLHTGYNTAIEYANTELMVCVDSDDYMPDDAVEKILTFWKKNGSKKYAGIIGLDYDLEGNRIGDFLPNQKTVNLIDLLTGKYNILNGDRTNVIRTELYKEVAPMKSFPGEKNFNPHYMHLEISKKYDFLVLNENLKFVEYQPGGMSDSMLHQYYSSPNSFAETRKLYLSLKGTSWKFKLKHSIHYVSSCILAKRGMKIAYTETSEKFYYIVGFLPGILLNFYIRMKG